MRSAGRDSVNLWVGVALPGGAFVAFCFALCERRVLEALAAGALIYYACSIVQLLVVFPSPSQLPTTLLLSPGTVVLVSVGVVVALRRRAVEASRAVVRSDAAKYDQIWENISSAEPTAIVALSASVGRATSSSQNCVRRSQSLSEVLSWLPRPEQSAVELGHRTVAQLNRLPCGYTEGVYMATKKAAEVDGGDELLGLRILECGIPKTQHVEMPVRSLDQVQFTQSQIIGNLDMKIKA